MGELLKVLRSMSRAPGPKWRDARANLLPSGEVSAMVVATTESPMLSCHIKDHHKDTQTF